MMLAVPQTTQAVAQTTKEIVVATQPLVVSFTPPISSTVTAEGPVTEEIEDAV